MKKASSEALQELAKSWGADRVRTDDETLKTHGRDWTTYFEIHAGAVVFPKTTNEVADLVRWARQHQIALIPSGGRTGLSGGACALEGEVVVSFDLMNQLRDFNPIDQTVIAGAGVITEDLQKYAHDKGLFYPVDFAARGSSQIGGNVATNAGGIKVLRYGMTREWIAGLTVVTGTGEILETGRGLVKNATGYDLRHLFIGSEGTLGFVTEVLVRLAPPPPPLRVLVLGAPDLDAVMKIYSAFKIGSQLTAFEMFSDKALGHVLVSTQLPPPFATQTPFYVVAEVECPNDATEERLLGIFEKCVEEGWVLDGSMAQSETQAKTFWRYREDISESLSKYSPYKNDIAVRVSKVPPFVADLDGILTAAYPTWEVVWFGHIGDGNLHINILRPSGMAKEDFVRECRKVDELIFDCVKRFDGSISAEHGVGLTKKSFLGFSRSGAEITLMKGIKTVFDPDGIINPGKLIDTQAGV